MSDNRRPVLEGMEGKFTIMEAGRKALLEGWAKMIRESPCPKCYVKPRIEGNFYVIGDPGCPLCGGWGFLSRSVREKGVTL